MKKNFLKTAVLFLIFCMTAFFSFSMSKTERERIVRQIKRDYIKTEQELGNYDKKKVEIKETDMVKYMSEGDSVFFFTKNGVLKKITAYSRNVQKTETEYYIRNKAPYFIVMTVKENNNEETGRREIYFDNNGRVVRIVDDGEVNDSGEYFEKYASDWSAIFYSVMSLIE